MCLQRFSSWLVLVEINKTGYIEIILSVMVSLQLSQIFFPFYRENWIVDAVVVHRLRDLAEIGAGRLTHELS